MIEEILHHLFLCFISAFFLFIWFDTEAVIEYIKALRLDSLFFIKEYEEKRNTIEDLTYPSYLEMYQTDFINKILSCVFCFCTWIVFLLTALSCAKYGVGTLKFFGFNWFASLVIYFSFSKFSIK